MTSPSPISSSYSFSLKGNFFLNRIVPPLLAFLLARLLLFLAAQSTGIDFFEPETWKRFDSNHYLSIAKQGFTLYPCTTEDHSTSHTWCGTSGWFPGYPLLIQSVSFLFPTLGWTAMVLSAVLHLACLILLWNGFLETSFKKESLLCLLLAAFFPGQVYHHAIFPISLLTLFTMLFFYYLIKKNIISAGLAAAGAGFSYPSGILLPGIGFLYLLMQKKVKSGLLLMSLGCLGPAMAALVFQVQVGHWDAYFKVHQKYDHTLSNPLATLSRAVQPVFHPEHWWSSSGLSLVTFKTEDGRFLCADNQSLLANRSVPGDWETFERITLGDKKIALRAYTGLFLCLSEDDGQTVLVRCPQIGPQAIFEEVQASAPFMALKAVNGLYLCPDDNHKLFPVRAACTDLKKPSLFKSESRAGSRGQQKAVVAGQTGFLFILLIVLLLPLLFRRPPQGSVDILMALFILVYWIFHYSLGSSLTLTRAEALLLPSIILGSRLSWKMLMALLLLAIPLAFFMGQLFFRYALV